LNNRKDAVPATAAAAAKGKKGKPDAADAEFEGLMSEIETDLRSDELKKIWSRYGTVLVAFVVLLVIGVTGFQLYRQQEAQQLETAARRYEIALQTHADGKVEEAMAELDLLSKEGVEAYSVLARLSLAALQVQRNDVDAALVNYKALAADERADPIFRDLAVLLQVLHTLDREDPKALEAQLTPLTSPDNAFNMSALELSALLAAKQGDTPRAVKTLEQITGDAAAPPSMRERAQDLISLYNSGVIPPPPSPASVTPAAAAPSPAPSAAPAPAPAAKP